MLDIYETLEIKKVLELISDYSKTEIAHDKILSLKMLASKKEVNESLTLLNEMMSLIYRHSLLPIDSSLDLSNYIDLALKGGVLTPLDLDRIVSDISLSEKLNEYFHKVEKNLYPNLIALESTLFDLSSLASSIRRVVLPNLNIKDDASKELQSIRRSIKEKENDARKLLLSLINRYKDNLSESSYTLRNDHYVLPFKSSDKNKVEGIIHDVSDSGQTTFIEPSQMVELSNNIYLLKKKEQEEIHRLLKELTNLVAVSANEIRNNNNVIAELDFIHAKARYANDNDCVVSTLTDERIIELKNAKHPLIDKSSVVANSFYLDEKQRLIIISGPNAGGKTVALKTLGLMVMMNQMGLALSTSESAHLSYFPRIFADIGDNQSLSDNLSTFSAHISNISTITHFVTSSDLVLIDELGTGTSPLEGESIALATLDYLVSKKCFGVISSHFDKVKEYAYSKDGIVNAMMIFDDKNLLPTYVLKIGLPGRSYGLEMAKRYHLNNEIVDNAKARINKSKKDDVNDILDKLGEVVKENDELNKSLKEKERLILAKENELKTKEETLNYKKENLLKDVEDTKEALLSDTNKKINEVLKLLENPSVTKGELLKAKKELSELSIVPEEISDEDIKVGDYVKVDSLGLVGKVKAIKGEKLELITTDGMSVSTKKNKVMLTSEPINTRVFKSNVDEMIKIKGDVKLELNIIGEHVEDGIILLSKYLDDARIKRFKQVRIVHGKGSGALRKAVHDYLKGCSFVEEYHVAGYYDGGDGATIVTLK